MNRSTVPCKIEILRDKPAPMLEQQSQHGQPTDVFNFALNWPMYGVPCSSHAEDLGELRSVHSPQSPPSSLEPEGGQAQTPAELRDTKLLCMDVSISGKQKKIKIERTAHIPFEITAMIISQTLVAPPKCAINLVVPDWSICERETPEVEKSLRITRIVTYIRDFDPNAFALDVEFSSEYTRQFYRSHTHVFTLGTSDVSNWGNLLPLRSQKLTAILPLDDEPTDAVKMRAGLVPVPIYQYIRHIAVHSPLELMQVTAENLRLAGYVDHEGKSEALSKALDLDRFAHLWLSWSKMPKLESVFLDLRIYSHDLNTERKCLSKFQVVDRAQEMGRHLQLKTLMLAGLQSYSFNVAYEGITARDVEEWDLINGEPNWIKIFRPAIREGGKIVLVDRLTDELLN